MYIAYFTPDLYINFVYNIYIIIIVLSLIFIYESNIKSSLKNIYKLFINKWIKYDDSSLTISEIHYSVNGRYLKYIIHNDKLLSNHEVLKPIYDTLLNDDTFINLS